MRAILGRPHRRHATSTTRRATNDMAVAPLCFRPRLVRSDEAQRIRLPRRSDVGPQEAVLEHARRPVLQRRWRLRLRLRFQVVAARSRGHRLRRRVTQHAVQPDDGKSTLDRRSSLAITLPIPIPIPILFSIFVYWHTRLYRVLYIRQTATSQPTYEIRHVAVRLATFL